MIEPLNHPGNLDYCGSWSKFVHASPRLPEETLPRDDGLQANEETI